MESHKFNLRKPCRDANGALWIGDIKLEAGNIIMIRWPTGHTRTYKLCNQRVANTPNGGFTLSHWVKTEIHGVTWTTYLDNVLDQIQINLITDTLFHPVVRNEGGEILLDGKVLKNNQMVRVLWPNGEIDDRRIQRRHVTLQGHPHTWNYWFTNPLGNGRFRRHNIRNEPIQLAILPKV